MHDREDVEIELVALEEGWTRKEAGALVGASGSGGVEVFPLV